MGGGAFKQATAQGHPTLNTPRMSPEEYEDLKGEYLYYIRAYFTDPGVTVAVLTEAPEKKDYGDMDVFIGIDREVNFLDLATRVGATGIIRHSPDKCTLGVRKDCTSSASPPIVYSTINTNSSSRSASPAETTITTEEYAQIDINVVPTDLVEWHIFHSACGDLNGMLGHMLTNLGFTISHHGLWLRMKELDASKTIERSSVSDADGKIFLSKDPDQVMQFLGISIDKWDRGFDTLDDFYAWLGACRMLHPVAIKLKRDRADDRHREQKRDVYRRFFFEWLPAHVPEMNESLEKEEQVRQIERLRERYLGEALDFFGKREVYEEKHAAMVLAVNNAVAANLLRPLVAKHSGTTQKKLPELLRAFRRFVKFDESGQPYVAAEAQTDAESQLHRFLDDQCSGLRDETEAEEFVKWKWEELKTVQRQQAKETTAAEKAEPGTE